MSSKDIRGLEVVDALNVIRQKHLNTLDAEDIGFMKAHETMLSEMDKNIYLKGMSPKKASETAPVFMSRNDRIIHENRPLQDIQTAQMASRNATIAPVVLPEDAEVDKEWKEKIASLHKEADVIKKTEDEESKAAAKRVAELEKEADKATPVRIVR